MRTRCWLIATALMAAMMVTAVDAGEDDDDVPVKKDEKADDVKLLATAAEIEEFGRMNKSPEALIAAAGILLRVNAITKGKFSDLDEDCVDEKGKKVVDKEESITLEKKAKGLLDSAAAMAAGQKVNVKPLIDAVANRKYDATRAVVGGPKRISRKIDASGKHHYTIHFVKNAPASIALQSNSPVRFMVRDSQLGTLVNAVAQHGNYSWVPKGKGGTVKISVIGGKKIANYTLYAN